MAVKNYGSGGTYLVSPGLSVNEIDNTPTTVSANTSTGAFAGVFRWGPIGERVTVASEGALKSAFGPPSDINGETWFSAANFLAYTNQLIVSRAANTQTQFSAIANTIAFAANSAHTIANADDYETKSATFDPSVAFIAKYPGAMGNSLKVSQCDSANQYTSTIPLGTADGTSTFGSANTQFALAVGSNTATITLANTVVLGNNTPLPYATTVAGLFDVGDYLLVGNNTIGKQYIKVTGVSSITVANTSGTNTGYASFTVSLAQPYKLSTNFVANTVPRYWEFYSAVGQAPQQTDYQKAYGNTAINDAMHVIVVDEDGAFSGSPGTVLETYANVSRASDAKNSDGTTNFYQNVINAKSSYVWTASQRATAVANTAAQLTSATSSVPLTISFQGGLDVSETAVAFADLANAADLFKSAEEVDFELLITGKSAHGVNGSQMANYLVDNIATVRNDCVVFVSPRYEDVVGVTKGQADNIVSTRNQMRNTSYAFMDSGYKYQYDKYNDVYRWIPLNGDIAGVAAYTDSVAGPWYSIAGINRGQIKNVVKLAYNPSGDDRDTLYSVQVNPVITQSGKGTFLFGDKTLLSSTSAFSRINVRRLFITIEKTIATTAKPYLFEFNDTFTRSQFVNEVDPYLRDVQGKRGITEYKIVCDTTNNTADIIDSEQFVADFYIKPARAINWIQLNFTAEGSGVTLSEIS